MEPASLTTSSPAPNHLDDHKEDEDQYYACKRATEAPQPLVFVVVFHVVRLGYVGPWLQTEIFEACGSILRFLGANFCPTQLEFLYWVLGVVLTGLDELCMPETQCFCASES